MACAGRGRGYSWRRGVTFVALQPAPPPARVPDSLDARRRARSWRRSRTARRSTCSSSAAASSARGRARRRHRGLSVALVERGDLAQGTSRWSSKLAHGGLRYLAHGEVGLAWESARERAC